MLSIMPGRGHKTGKIIRKYCYGKTIGRVAAAFSESIKGYSDH